MPVTAETGRRDRRRVAIAGAVATLAWAVLLAAAPAGVTWLCGPDATPNLPFDISRLAGLSTLWGLMTLATMLPCGIAAALVTGAPYRVAAGTMMAGALVGALAQWLIESLTAMGVAVTGVPLSMALVAGALAIEVGRKGRPSLAAPVAQMVALHLAGVPMDPLWMAAVMLWMLAGTLTSRTAAPLMPVHCPLPRKRAGI